MAKTVSHSPVPLQTVSKPEPSWARAHDPKRKKKKSGYRGRGLRVTRNEIIEPGPETMCSPICKSYDTDMGNQTKVGQKTACKPTGPGSSRHHTDEKTMSVRPREKVILNCKYLQDNSDKCGHPANCSLRLSKLLQKHLFLHCYSGSIQNKQHCGFVC